MMEASSVPELYWMPYGDEVREISLESWERREIRHALQRIGQGAQEEQQRIEGFALDAKQAGYIIDRLRAAKIDLEGEAQRIESALGALLRADLLGPEEPEVDECKIGLIRHYQQLAADLRSLMQERVTVDTLQEVVTRYPRLNERVILGAFNQPKNAIAAEFVVTSRDALQARGIPNDKTTRLTSQLQELAETLFGVKPSRRDLAKHQRSALTVHLLQL